MSVDDVVSDEKITETLKGLGFTQCAKEGRLMLVELLVKANDCSYNSHTEEAFVQSFGMLNKNRKLNKKGSRFLCDMLYASSNNKSEFAKASDTFRK